MDYEDYINLGLNGAAPLKIIMHGNVKDVENGKIGVVSVVFATMDKELAKNQLEMLNARLLHGL